MPVELKDIKVLIINGSPRKKNNSSTFVNAVVKGVESTGATAVVYNLAGKKFEHCLEHCKAYHKKTGNCMIDDDLHELSNEWYRADGVIYVVPLFHMGMPSALYSIITRMGATVFGHSDGKVPMLLKAGGAVVHGNTQYGGQEMVMEYINAHLMLMNCVPVTGDKPEAYIGTGARVLNDGTVERDLEVLDNTFSLGVRVVEMASILKAGRAAQKDVLPKEYQIDTNREFCAPKKEAKQ